MENSWILAPRQIKEAREGRTGSVATSTSHPRFKNASAPASAASATPSLLGGKEKAAMRIFKGNLVRIFLCESEGGSPHNRDFLRQVSQTLHHVSMSGRAVMPNDHASWT